MLRSLGLYCKKTWTRRQGNSFETGPEDARCHVSTHRGGFTVLHIALATGPFHDKIGNNSDKERLEIASMLVEGGVSGERVANYFRLQDVIEFGTFPGLWNKLRVGITV
ncbi:ankyrin repeat-containing [Colletotrichum graminicola]|nr:ankyrin repeat-containing [Colletotrichum graminicola]